MLNKKLQNQLNSQINQRLLRKRHVVNKRKDNNIKIKGYQCIDFSSNDYLGLTKHPTVTSAFIKSAKKYGTGSGASAFVSGYSEIHEKTESLFAEWLNVDKAVLFNSGYCANLGIIKAIAGRSDAIFSDKLCHASLLDGIALSHAKHLRYQHCDTQHLKQLAKIYKPSLIVTESVFSMEGRIAPIPDLIHLAKEYQSGLLIDDAHGIGVLGENGKGISEYFGLKQYDFSCLIIPLGKSFNAIGAIVAGQSNVMKSIIQFSKSYRHTTALPPPICSAILAALYIIQKERWRKNQLIKNIQYFIAYAKEKNLKLLSSDKTPIKPILVYDNQKALALQNFLLSKGFYISAIRPPTVPRNKAILRISLNSLHTQDQMTQLINSILIGLTNVE